MPHLLPNFITGLLLTFCLLAQAQAVVIKDLYEVLIPVKSQSKEERQEALQEGLRQVMVKVSGSTALIVGEDPVVEMALENPNNFVQQFRYRAVQAGTISSSRSTRTERVLWVKYDEKAINKLLRNNGQPVWGRTRPVTLVWLVVAEQSNRILLSSKDKHPAISAVENYARQRGLPIQLPLMDMTDRAKLSISDVWGNFEGPIMQASLRYRPEAVMVGRLYMGANESWNARWSIYQDGRREDIDIDGELLIDTISPVIAKTAETLAQRFAVVATEESNDDVLVEVTGVDSLAEYNRIVKYLTSLTVVSKVQPYSVSGKSASFRLTTRSGRLDVAQAIELGRVLVVQHQVQIAGDGKSLKPDLVYQLKQ